MDDDATRIESPTVPTEPAPPKRRRWRRFFRRSLIVLGILLTCVAYSLKDYYRTLASLRKIPGTKAYVMDYYVDYHIGEVRAHGIDVKHVENSVIGVLLPSWTHSIAMRLKSTFLPEHIEAIDNDHHCSTLMLHPQQGDVFFGRNFDFLHDACLILKVHKGGEVSSVAVLDLRFLNLNRGDLETTSLLRRIPLLFAPYYLQDGMNQYGVAVADMAVHGVKTPYDPAKPNIIHSLAMRLILDYAKSTDEAVDLLRQYNVYFVAVQCHLLIADATGKSVVIEFINGEMKTTPTKENWQVCTNHEICGKSEAENDAACKRYRTASDELAAIGGNVSSNDVMKVMESVKQPSTMWSSVYDLSTGDFSVAYRREYDKTYADHLPMLVHGASHTVRELNTRDMPPSNGSDDAPLPRLTADGDWAMLEGDNDGQPMIVRRNDSAKQYAGHPELPFRLGVAVPFLSPDENGFPAAEETADLNEIEDALVDHLQEHQVGVLTLVITTGGMREFVSYVRSAEAGDAAVEAAAAGGEDHEIQYYVEEDPQWEVYSQFD